MNCFRCARTGMYFPPDYVENWGKKYGIGFGPVPISECLVNRYDFPIMEAKSSSQTMHPVGVCRAQVDFVDVPDADYNERKAVLAADDPDMTIRAGIMRQRQMVHSSKMRSKFPSEVETEELTVS